MGWSLDTVGNGYQLLGVLIAGIGIPVVAPRLMQAERTLDRWRASGERLGSGRDLMRCAAGGGDGGGAMTRRCMSSQ